MLFCLSSTFCQNVSQKYDVILQIFKISKYHNILTFTVLLNIPITSLILQNHQLGRFAAKNYETAEIAFCPFWSNVTYSPDIRSMSSLNLAIFVELAQCHRTEFTKCTKLHLSASYRLTANKNGIILHHYSLQILSLICTLRI